MLLTKIVKVKWHNKNREWYINKGYEFTKMKDEFEVKVEDLTSRSTGLVEVKCDCEECENSYLKPMKWSNYIINIHKDNKYYCNTCAKKRSHGIGIKTRLKNGKSFEQWCLENNREDVLERWDYKLNGCNPNDVSYCSGGFQMKGYWFKCPMKIHESELKHIEDFINGHNGTMDCKKCNSFGKYLISAYGENALYLYWSNKNILNPWNISYGSKNKVLIKCQEKDYHEDYYVDCFEFSQRNSRCPHCTNKKVHPLDSLGKILEDKNLLSIWSNKNKKSPYEYAPNSQQKVWWNCFDKEHENYKRDICSSNVYGFRCPECMQKRTESLLQEKVRLYLEDLKYIILNENKCTIVPRNPKTNRDLPFDNEIKELKLICEVHGKQHYILTGFHKLHAKQNNTTPKYELHYQQLKDRYKRIIAIQQGYFYLEIPYWADDKNETWKQLIDSKLKEILNTKEVF